MITRRHCKDRKERRSITSSRLCVTQTVQRVAQCSKERNERRTFDQLFEIEHKYGRDLHDLFEQVELLLGGFELVQELVPALALDLEHLDGIEGLAGSDLALQFQVLLQVAVHVHSAALDKKKEQKRDSFSFVFFCPGT